ILASDQDSLALRFSQTGIDRFAELPLTRGAGDVPLLDGAAARFECRTAFQYAGGDHIIFVGEVLAFDHWDRVPLLFHRGRFALAAPK
ncbi:MAG: flavin reductase family protein, partial [Polyangiales bacterium]